MCDRPRPGQQHTACNPDIIQKVSNKISEDRRETVRSVAADLGISKSSVHNILKKDLSLTKLCLKFIPKLLTQEQKDFCV